MISAVVAYTKKSRTIGDKDGIPWSGKMANDMLHVRELTDGTALIMGAKTFDSIGFALPGRQNIVLSKTAKNIDDVDFVTNLDDAVANVEPGREIVIFGGGYVYREALPITQRIYATEIDADFNGDTTFPEIDMNEWIETAREDFLADAKNAYPYSFVKYDRIAKV